MRHTIAVVAVLYSLFASGCAKFDAKNIQPEGVSTPEPPPIEPIQPQPVPTTPSQPIVEPIKDVPLTENQITFEVKPGEKPEVYLVNFTWPKLTNGRRLRFRSEQSQITTPEPDQTSYSSEVSHNQTLTYTIDVFKENDKLENTFSKQVKIPVDLVISSAQSRLKGNFKIEANRVFLSSALLTNGYKLEITANELHSNNGVIETFPEGTKAQPNERGRSGGEILLNVGYAKGSLKVFMRGEHGGDGSNATSYTTKAADGAAAGDGQQECNCVGKSCADRPTSAKLTWNTSGLRPQEICYCITTGDNATNGTDGAKGRKGKPGQDGGSTGTFKAIFKDGKDLSLQTVKRPGSAGTPGRGGDGQIGGKGGGGKNTDNRNDCRGRAGTDGANGTDGEAGASGSDGKPDPVCIQLSAEGKSVCE